MAMNRIQFQHGVSLPEFLRDFGTESQCAEAVRQARWPLGFRCPKCGGSAHCVITVESRHLFQCNACRRQTSLTTGSLFAATKLPLTTWFLAIYLISQAKTGLSALALKRQLGVSCPTAWLLHHKILRAMARRDDVHPLDGQVQLDNAYLGGERARLDAELLALRAERLTLSDSGAAVRKMRIGARVLAIRNERAGLREDGAVSG